MEQTSKRYNRIFSSMQGNLQDSVRDFFRSARLPASVTHTCRVAGGMAVLGIRVTGICLDGHRDVPVDLEYMYSEIEHEAEVSVVVYGKELYTCYFYSEEEFLKFLSDESRVLDIVSRGTDSAARAFGLTYNYSLLSQAV